SLQCVVADGHRIQPRRPPPPLESEDKPRSQRFFFWRRNNVELSSKRISANGTLEVYRKQNNSEGVYQCLAWHQGGLVLGYPVHLKFAHFLSKPCVVNVRSPSPVSFLPVYQEENIVTSRGSTVMLPCPVLGWPLPKINWVKNGDQTAIDSTSQVLVLRNIERRHQGIYKCKIEDENLEKIFNVTVAEPVNITIPPTPKEVIRATTVRFNCTAEGHPKPTITWYRNGKPLLMGGRFNQRLSPKENRMELVVGGVTSEDAGVYQCFASNAISVASSWAILKVTGEGAPPPGDVQCWPTGPRSVLVRWSRPDAYNIVAYTVQTSVSAGTSSSPGQPHTNTKEEISVPKSLTPYTFQVRAVIQTITKKNIASDMSDGVVCQGQGVPIQMSRPSDDKVLVSWKEFAKESPGVVQWVLQHRAMNGSREENVTLVADDTSYTLTVPTSEPLLVRVLGSRSVDWLSQNLTLVPWSSTESLDHGISSVVPEAVRATHVGTQEFTVTWRCETQVRLHGYRVCATNDDGFKKCADTDREWVTFENLEPATEYEVTVQARVPGHQLELPSSLPMHITTLPLVSARFKEVSCKFVNSTALLVSWNANSPKFTVSYTNKIYIPLEQWDTIDTTRSSVLISGIDRSSETILKVTAYNPEESSKVIDCHAAKIKDLHYTFIPSGVRVSWNGTGIQTVRPRRRNMSPNEGDDEEASEMKNIGGGLANGGGSKDAGEPLLNGHVHITENPQSKTANGKMRRGRPYHDAFDLSRPGGALLDTSRSPQSRCPSSRDISANNSFNKLPDDNMNSELTRSTDFESDNSKIQPTLQPNG
ncbi:protogenin B, partial [Aphomia sociella]